MNRVYMNFRGSEQCIAHMPLPLFDLVPSRIKKGFSMYLLHDQSMLLVHNWRRDSDAEELYTKEKLLDHRLVLRLHCFSMAMAFGAYGHNEDTRQQDGYRQCAQLDLDLTCSDEQYLLLGNRDPR